MKKTLTGVVAGWTLLYGGLVPSVAQSPETPLKIEVHLYNYSGVSAEALARGEQETARIYRHLGVEMEWRHCPRTAEELEQNPTCDLPASTTTLTVRLLSNEMGHRFPVHDDIYGFALLPLNQGFGATANVFADRARDMAADDELHRVILGHLIAHELGHLLLGEAGHPAGAGIMHVPWQTKELERIKQGAMFFLPEQAEKIRARVLARMTSSNHSTAPHHPAAGTLPAAEPSPKITVFVYNYAAIPADVLAQTEAEAARIYQHVGIEVRWLDCPLSPGEVSQFPACQVPPGPTKPALRILSQSMVERLRQAQDSFGFALYPEDGSFVVVANVFAHDAEQLASRRGMRQGVILGHLVAHELGHMLLGAMSHSSAA